MIHQISLEGTFSELFFFNLKSSYILNNFDEYLKIAKMFISLKVDVEYSCLRKKKVLFHLPEFQHL